MKILSLIEANLSADSFGFATVGDGGYFECNLCRHGEVQVQGGRTHSGIIPAMLEAVRVDAVVGRLNGPSPLTKLIFST